MAHPLSQWAQAVLQAYVAQQRLGYNGTGHPHCAAAATCATRRRELHSSHKLRARQGFLVASEALIVLFRDGMGVRHHAVFYAGAPHARGTRHARVFVRLSQSLERPFLAGV